MGKNVRMYLKFLRIQYLSGLQYKGWPIMVVQTALVSICDPALVLVLFWRFGTVGAWTVERVGLIYALAITGFGLAETFCRGFDYFPWFILRAGAFDRVMLRPRALTWQVAASYFHLHRLGRVGVGMGIIVWSLARMGIALTAGRALLLVLTLAGGTLMYAGVFIATSGISFFTIQALDWIYMFTNASYSVTRCPIEHVPRWFRRVCTFVLPVLPISYYPASTLCGWGEPAALGWLALPLGLAFLLASTLLWRLGVRHYGSTGS